MAIRARIPQQLKAAPFTLAEARKCGLTLDSLRGKAWQRIGSELYCWKGLRDDAWLLLGAWSRRLPAKSVFSGKTAAFILGLDFESANPVEVTLPADTSVRTRAGLTVRRSRLSLREVRTVRGLRTTNIQRTLRDLAATLPAVEALVAIDMALHRRLANPDSLRHLSLAKFAAPAESPMETRLRWMLLQAHLPRPEVQTDLHDAGGRFVGRADLFYREARLVIEYDGGNHRERLVEDDRRQNQLLNADFRMLRFTAADVYQRPELVVAQVRGVLAGPYQVNSRRGWRTSS